MARVASCPHCEHELFVPDDADPSALAKCPKCRAFFELRDAASRELPALLVVGPTVDEAEPQSSPTAADTPPVATSSSHTSDQEYNLAFGRDDEQSPDFSQPQQPVPAPRIAQHAHKDPVTEPEQHESPEDAAQRIDAWFKSAKTLSDIPQSASAAADHIDLGDLAAGGATIDLSADDAGVAESNADFELEPPTELHGDAAAWDNSQHMDRLLADLQDQPTDTYEPTAREHVPATEEDHFQQAEDWSPDVPVSMTPGAAGPRRKRSLVRTMIMTVVGGVIGLGLGYYALLWIRGPEIDRLDLARYLPKAILPPSFRTETKPPSTAQPSSMAADLAASEKVSKEVPQPPETPAEQQATFTAPAEPAKTSKSSDDRYALPPAKEERAVREPAELKEPPATALTASAPPAAAVRIANAPSFTAGELSTSLEVAKQAQPRLVAGNLSDGRAIAQTKGAGYMALADLAQKAIFVDETASSADATHKQVDELFRQTLSSAHTRNEVAQIAPKWIGLAKRQHGGVFFAGSVTRHESKGTVVECSVDIGDGQLLTVLLPASEAKQLDGSTRLVGVIGWIVSKPAEQGWVVGKPAEQVEGYTGSAAQAVFAKKLISLE